MNHSPSPDERATRLLALMTMGINLHAAQSAKAQLGDRAAYIGMSDIGQYMDCPRAAVLRRLSLPKREEDFSRTLTLQRGHWFEDGVAQALLALHLPFVRQLEIALNVDACPVRAHLDFVLASSAPRPTVRILEVKSMSHLPDSLYASHEAQVYGQIGLLARCWNLPAFNLKDETGTPVFSHLTFPQAAKVLWGMTLPDALSQVDVDAWVLALSMTNAKAFGPYRPNDAILNACLTSAQELWRKQELGRQETLAPESLPVAAGFHPLCSCCDDNSDCPKFAGQTHPELEEALEELALWKAQRSALDAEIKEREAHMKEWYAHAGAQGQWIEAGGRRFRVFHQPGKRTLDRDSLAEELDSLFQVEGIEGIDVPAFLARHEKMGKASTRLIITHLLP